ncbi:MAG: single-stranded-DNA-specific exonuclease RecJ [Tepidibacillus sp.]
MKWNPIPSKDESFITSLNQQMKILGQSPIHPFIAKHLATLGLTVPEMVKFLFPQKEHAHSPWLLKGMREMIEQLEDAIVSGKHITIVGDYDVDGVGATAIAMKALTSLGANVDYYIPDRKKEGYGIKPLVVEALKQRGTEVILTVDNGISANDAVSYAKSYGMTVLVSDHHTPGGTLPEADVLINPKQPQCEYPFKGISGGAVAYKIVQALYEQMGYPEEAYEEYLDLVALTTVADVMPMVDENRYFVQEGLKQMRENPSLPIQSLMKVLKIDKRQLSESTLGFYFGPTLNAPGRLAHAETSVQLLLAKTQLESLILANECNEYNKQRQILLEEALKEAAPLLTSNPVQVLKLDVEEGIAGVVAGQIKENTNSPIFVFTPALNEQGETILKGSGRSIPGFSLYLGLKAVADQHPKWFYTYGGHDGAAGVSIYPRYLDDFRIAINDIFKKTTVPEVEEYYVDEVKVEELEELSHHVRLLAPFGNQNPNPCVKVKTVIKDTVIFGLKQNHLRLFTEEGMELTLFRGSHLQVEKDKEAEVFLTINRSFFAGREKLDLFLQDIIQ